MMAINEGVGKKIVEALKKQSEPEIEFTKEYSETPENAETEKVNEEMENPTSVEVAGIDTLYDIPEKTEETSIKEDSFEIKENFPNVEEHNDNLFTNRENVATSMPQQPQGWNFDIKEEPQIMSYTQPQINTESLTEAKQFDMPPNVAVLKRLIMQLPSGVTKQTGAQIIKQTMEALGISMNTVLHEAQKVQDDMNESIKNCMISIQEYKNNIRNLEKQGMDYQRQVNQLNDLISLFILSDKE